MDVAAKGVSSLGLSSLRSPAECLALRTWADVKEKILPSVRHACSCRQCLARAGEEIAHLRLAVAAEWSGLDLKVLGGHLDNLVRKEPRSRLRPWDTIAMTLRHEA